MAYKTQNYVTWDEYLEKHPNVADVPAAKKIQAYEDQAFSLVRRLFR